MLHKRLLHKCFNTELLAANEGLLFADQKKRRQTCRKLLVRVSRQERWVALLSAFRGNVPVMRARDHAKLQAIPRKVHLTTNIICKLRIPLQCFKLRWDKGKVRNTGDKYCRNRTSPLGEKKRGRGGGEKRGGKWQEKRGSGEKRGKGQEKRRRRVRRKNMSKIKRFHNGLF